MADEEIIGHNKLTIRQPITRLRLDDGKKQQRALLRGKVQRLTLHGHGLQGRPGRDGASADAADLVKQAGIALNGHRAVIVDADDKVYLADPSDEDRCIPIGVTVGAAAQGSDASIRQSGIIVEPSWNWQPGEVFLGAGGTLTQTPPPSGAVCIVGIAAGPDTLRISPQFIAFQI